ncbi:hypothetical protein BSKO_07371 [Bryopsis sp. KO-2023]|nr:hypothetical protein BSKO_07371 [Bryopsis sp. KO-2023]
MTGEDALQMEAAEEMKEVEEVLEEHSDGQEESRGGDMDESGSMGGDMDDEKTGSTVPGIEEGGEDPPTVKAEGRVDGSADIKMHTVDARGDGSGASEDPLKMPPHGTEVYIGGLAKSATDAQIRRFCETAGEVYSLRCTKDPGIPGKNRGYAFVTYMTTDQAATAVETLNSQELKDFPGKTVRVIMSQVKNRLFIGNVPKDVKLEDMQELLDKEVRGVTEVELLMDRERNMNRGFCFVEFYNHSAADLARKILSRPDFRLRERVLTVTWAEPKKVDSDQEQVKSVYVGNLPESVTEAKLRDIFKAYGEVEKVVLPLGVDGRRFREYGFVHYTERACALKAIEAAEEEKPTLEGKDLTVAMAKPPTQTRDPMEMPRRTPPSSMGGIPRLGGMGAGMGAMAGGGLGMARGRGRPMPGRGMGYGGGEYGYGGGGEMDGYGAYAGGGAGSGGGYMAGMALVPMYLPNGQVAFVFQHQGAGGMPPGPGAGGPVRNNYRSNDGPNQPGGGYSRGPEREEYGGGGHGGRYSRSNSSRANNPTNSNDGQRGGANVSRYRPY